MVDEQFRILAEQLVKQIFIPFGTEGNIAHRKHPILLKFLGNAPTHAPKVRERLMRPKLTSELHLIQLCNADAVFVGGDVPVSYTHLSYPSMCLEGLFCIFFRQ